MSGPRPGRLRAHLAGLWLGHTLAAISLVAALAAGLEVAEGSGDWSAGALGLGRLGRRGLGAALEAALCTLPWTVLAGTAWAAERLRRQGLLVALAAAGLRPAAIGRAWAPGLALVVAAGAALAPDALPWAAARRQGPPAAAGEVVVARGGSLLILRPAGAGLWRPHWWQAHEGLLVGLGCAPALPLTAAAADPRGWAGARALALGPGAAERWALPPLSPALPGALAAGRGGARPPAMMGWRALGQVVAERRALGLDTLRWRQERARRAALPFWPLAVSAWAWPLLSVPRRRPPARQLGWLGVALLAAALAERAAAARLAAAWPVASAPWAALVAAGGWWALSRGRERSARSSGRAPPGGRRWPRPRSRG